MKGTPYTAIVVALALMVAACGRAGEVRTDSPPTPQGMHGDHERGGHGEPTDPGAHAHHGHGLTATAGPGYTVADVHFMQMMMGHHAQAVAMSDLVSSRDAGPEVTRLALRIDISQRDELELMRQWLLGRGQEVPTEEQMGAMEMPGLVPPEDMARLEASRGVEFDRLFLQLMIHHHLGAIEMVEHLFAIPGAGQDPDIFQFATDVANDQLDEINVMERILDRLPTPSRSEIP
jgi:uncharacterized protein (DUF305 family)